MVVMKSKDIHIALKRDDCISYLMERFGFAEKEELFEAIKKVSPSGAEDFIKRLEKKQKLIERREKNNNSFAETNMEEVQNEEQPVQQREETVTLVNAEGCVEVDIEQEDEKMQKLPDIEKLKEQEQELSIMLCNLEVRHKEFVTKRRIIVRQLEKAQKALIELRRLLSEQEQNVNKIYDEYLACAHEMESINEERKSCNSLLEEIRTQISELKKITVLVYQNGKIEVENAEIPSISEEEVIAEFKRLACMPEAEDMTIKELKTIAKLLKMVEVYKANNSSFELEFDSAKVQRLWETVIA